MPDRRYKLTVTIEAESIDDLHDELEELQHDITHEIDSGYRNVPKSRHSWELVDQLVQEGKGANG